MTDTKNTTETNTEINTEELTEQQLEQLDGGYRFKRPSIFRTYSSLSSDGDEEEEMQG